MEQYGLSLYDAGLLTASRSIADFFEAVLEAKPLMGEAQQQLAKSVSNWVLGELARLLNATGSTIEDVKIQTQHLVELLDMIAEGSLSTGMAKTVFEEMFNNGKPPRQIVEEAGMVQISDADAVSPAVEEAVAGNPDAVEDYLKGKETAMRFLVGQVMIVTKGKANPQIAAQLLKEMLESMK